MEWSELEKVVTDLMQSTRVPEEIKLNCISFVGVLMAKDRIYHATSLFSD